MQNFEYRPLDASRRGVRMLQLQYPDKESNDCTSNLICCRLDQASLDDNPVYQALSYTWGDPNRVCTIIFNGQKISVGANLEEALQYFYSISYLGLLWVDAICINQNDKDEKNWQVQQMRDIYAQAEFVIAWLGAAQMEVILQWKNSQ